MTLKIHKGIEILLDEEDVERILRHLADGCTWYFNPKDEQVQGWCNTEFGKRKFQLSRVIMKCYNSKLCVDHKNHNKLDYRKSELRICTKQQNNFNRKLYTFSESGYKGVSKHPTNGLWRTRIMINKKEIPLGYFNSALEAAKAYDAKARELFGEFAKLNFNEN